MCMFPTPDPMLSSERGELGRLSTPTRPSPKDIVVVNADSGMTNWDGGKPTAAVTNYQGPDGDGGLDEKRASD